jgi:hypothetical protein
MMACKLFPLPPLNPLCQLNVIVSQLLIFFKVGAITLLNDWIMINWKGCGCDPTGGTIPAYAWRDRGKLGKPHIQHSHLSWSNSLK